MLGGLRPFTTEAMHPDLREEILHHWHEVHKLSGQPFSFEGALADGFIYDTEPACRAVITMGNLKNENIFAYFTAIQSAFYVDQQDVTRTDILASLAVLQGITEDQFLNYFNSEEARQKTMQHFTGTQQAGVRGFPSLVIQQGAEFEFISRGYQSLDTLDKTIRDWLNNHTS